MVCVFLFCHLLRFFNLLKFSKKKFYFTFYLYLFFYFFAAFDLIFNISVFLQYLHLILPFLMFNYEEFIYTCDVSLYTYKHEYKHFPLILAFLSVFSMILVTMSAIMIVFSFRAFVAAPGMNLISSSAFFFFLRVV